jgi:hypothetical protein
MRRWRRLDPARVLPAPPEEVYKLPGAGMIGGEAGRTERQRRMVGPRTDWFCVAIRDRNTAFEYLNALYFIPDLTCPP